MLKIAVMFNENRNNAGFTACLIRMGMIVLFSVALLLTLFDLASASGQTVSLLPQDQVGMENETGSMGSICIIKTEQNFKSNDSINISGTQPLSNLPIGAKVVDYSWEWQFRTGNNYSGAGETKPVTWIVVAKNHYGANSGVTLISEELIGLHLFDNSTNRGSDWGSNHWGDSGTNNAMRGSRTFLNSTGIDAWTGFYFAFSESFISNIITTAVPNKIWVTGATYNTQDKVFIPSTTELGDTSHSSTYQIGTVYPYFEGSTDAERLAKLDGTNRFYLTRSPSSADAGVLRSIGSGGSFNDNSADNSSGGLRPALNVQSETPVSLSPNDDGSYSFLPQVITLIAPAHNANVVGTRVVFKWDAAAGATRYQLQVRRIIDNSIFRNLTLDNVTQRAIPNFPANGTQYKWRVRAGNAIDWGQWSAYRQFKNHFGVFNHNFNTTDGYRGWIRRPQAVWNLTSAAMRTAGQANRYVSARRGNVYYHNLDYSVRMRRTNSNLGEQYLVFRAGTKYAASGLWHSGYAFGYRNNGTYRVLRLNANGSITQLKGWTNSNRINKGGFNTLRVRAVGNNLRFFINGTQVHQLNNSTFARGTVGVMMYRTGGDPASTRLLVDWAKISNPVTSAAYEEEIMLQEIFEEEVFEEDLVEIIEELLDEQEESLSEEDFEE